MNPNKNTPVISVGASFGKNSLTHSPAARLDWDTYKEILKNIEFACLDYTCINPSTGDLLLIDRATPPQQGLWFFGGRVDYSKPLKDTGVSFAKKELGLDIDASRIDAVTVIQTAFSEASPEDTSFGRSTLNVDAAITLTPQEIDRVNSLIAKSHSDTEFSSIGWHSQEDIIRGDYPWALKHFVRTLQEQQAAAALMQEQIYGSDESTFAGLGRAAKRLIGKGPKTLQEQAIEENEQRSDPKFIKQQEEKKNRAIEQISAEAKLPKDIVSILYKYSAPFINTAIQYYKKMFVNNKPKNKQTADSIANILNNNDNDEAIIRDLNKYGLPVPPIKSINGPALRAVLIAVSKALDTQN